SNIGMILKERQDGVLVLTLNRPEKLNAITGELLDALYAALKEGEEDREVRALLLTGAGRAFSAGQDLTEFGDRKPDYEAHLRRYNRVVEALSGLEKPLVVAVNGVAAGAGMSLALWGDLRLAAVGASFTTAFVRIGLVPDSGLSFLLPRLVGLAKAQELLLLSPRLSAEEALALGLVHRVVPAEKLMEEALSLAKELAQGPTRAYALTKKLLLETYRLSLTEALALEAVLQGQAGQTQDHEEGVRAFREKRPPRFQGR
nr:Chain AAA, Enoyl-CoA hydratase/carnithine racemase [Thermus thermophilus JL-18]